MRAAKMIAEGRTVKPIRRIVLALASGLTMIAVGACGGGTQTSPTAKAGGTVTVRLPVPDWDTLDPAKAYNGASWQITVGPYDRLLAQGPGLKITPYLAQSWVVSQGSITFKVRTDAVCEDGTKVTTAVIADSLKRFFSAGGLYLQNFGPGPYFVTADDAEHVTVKVGSKSTDLLYPFSEPPTGIVCPSGLAPNADFEHHSYGSGPYTLQSAIHADTAVEQLRSGWKWGPSGTTAKTPGLPQKVIFKSVSLDATAANLLVTGGLDVATIVGPDVDRLKREPTLQDHLASSYLANILIFNHTDGRATADPMVRLALSHAIDQNAYRVAFGGRGIVTTSLMAPGANCFEPATQSIFPKTSVSDAQSALKSAGYVLGSDGKFAKNGRLLTVTIVGTPSENAAPEYLLEAFSKIGVTTNLLITDSSTALKNRTGTNWDIYLQIGKNSVPDPNFFIGFYGGAPPPPQGANYGRITNPVAVREFDLAKTALGSEQCAHSRAAQLALIQEHDVFPLFVSQFDQFSRGINFIPSGSYLDVTAFRRV